MTSKPLMSLAVLVVLSGVLSLALGVGDKRTSASGRSSVYFPIAAKNARLDWPPEGPNDWPQVQKNPQRTGFTSETVGANFQRRWTLPFQPERVHPQVQAIVYANRVFVGTETGTLYAIDAASGAKLWAFAAGAPIVSSAAASEGRVYFATLGGVAFALDVQTGGQLWRRQLSPRLGFSSAPLLADSGVMFGGRDGHFYKLNPATGNPLWTRDVGSPILQTAAWNSGRAFFGTMDMRVHAVRTVDGSLTWQSRKLDGMAFKDYWPVVTQGKVIARSMGLGGLPVRNYSDSVQNDALSKYDSNPTPITMHVLDEQTGQELPAVVHWDAAGTMHGASTPPCVDRDGLLVVPAQRPDDYGNPWMSGWARVSLVTRKVVEGLIDPTDLSAGYGNPDENMNVTCAKNGALCFHTEEYNAQYTGFYDFDLRHWTRVPVGHTSRQLSTNTQGAGGNPPSVSSGWVYHISYHELIARTVN